MFVGGLREVLNTCNFFCTVYISHFSSFWNIITREQGPGIVIAKEGQVNSN